MSDKTLKDLTVDAHIAVLHTKVDALIEKQKELTERVRANEKVVAALGVLGTIAIAFIGAGAFAPRAEACSPPADGSEFTCPPPDVFCLGMEVCPRGPIVTPLVKETETPDYYSDYQTVTVYDTREPVKWDHGSVIQKMRDWKSAQGRPSVEDMINASLMEYSIETEQEE